MKSENKLLTVETYKEKFHHRSTVSMSRCQFCDCFVKPNNEKIVIAGGCKEMKKQCSDARFNTTEISMTCDNYKNEGNKFI